jgi:hypothetical protein
MSYICVDCGTQVTIILSTRRDERDTEGSAFVPSRSDEGVIQEKAFLPSRIVEFVAQESVFFLSTEKLNSAQKTRLPEFEN